MSRRKEGEMTKMMKLTGRKPQIKLKRQPKKSFMLLLPSLVCIGILSQFPILRGVYIGFTNYKVGMPIEFNGLYNYGYILDKLPENPVLSPRTRRHPPVPSPSAAPRHHPSPECQAPQKMRSVPPVPQASA